MSRLGRNDTKKRLLRRVIQIEKWNANLLRSAAVEGIRVRLRVTVDVRTGI